MWVTQDLILNVFFQEKIIIGRELLVNLKGSIILAPTHRSRWDGLILTYALGRRITNMDCRFMVTNPEMRGIQGWFLKRLGCFSVNQESPSLQSLRYAVDLIVNNKLLVIFPEGRINKNSKNLPLKEGLFRLAQMGNRKVKSVHVIPIGIAYEQINPKFRSKVSLCIESPISLSDYSYSDIKEFNDQLGIKIKKAETKAKNLIN